MKYFNKIKAKTNYSLTFLICGSLFTLIVPQLVFRPSFEQRNFRMQIRSDTTAQIGSVVFTQRVPMLVCLKRFCCGN